MASRAGAATLTEGVTAQDGEGSMTEPEWLACVELEEMLRFLGGWPEDLSWNEPEAIEALHRWPGGRKLRLFACACARRVWAGLADGAISEVEKEACRRAVESAERYADGSAGEPELAACTAHEPPEGYDVSADGSAAASCLYCADVPVDAGEASHRAAQAGAYLREPRGSRKKSWYRGYDDEVASQCNLLRDIVGNPFRPVTLDPAVLTPTVLDLAQAGYDERDLPAGTLDPARLAVLADALEEAGCTESNILSHLRSPGPHVRGCWALDLILRKG
jgi:hypothetical protein